MEEAIESKPLIWQRMKKFAITTTNGMAIGLFGTLIIGTILDLFVRIPGMEFVGSFSTVIKGLMGAGIGLGVALALKLDGIKAVTLMAAGLVGNYAMIWVETPDFVASGVPMAQFSVGAMGDPLSCYLCTILVFWVLELVLRKKTPFDLLLIPLLGLAVAVAYGVLCGQWIHFITIGIGKAVEASFAYVPFLMCIVVSALVGMALTAPISSVAICVAIQIGNVPLAAASALIGCCTQMVGFAVHTARDNKAGAVLAVGLGTSMLQFKNILRKPLVWLPTIIVSALLGPFAMLFPLDGMPGDKAATLSVGAGMGTSGLVGPLNFLSSIGYDKWQLYLLLFGVCIVAPLLLVFGLDLLFRRIGWIKEGDFAL